MRNRPSIGAENIFTVALLEREQKPVFDFGFDLSSANSSSEGVGSKLSSAVVIAGVRYIELSYLAAASLDLRQQFALHKQRL